MANSKTRTPRKKTVEDVFNAVKSKAGMNRKSIMIVANKTGHCTDLCLDALITSDRIVKKFIRMSGPYKVWAYEVKQ